MDFDCNCALKKFSLANNLIAGLQLVLLSTVYKREFPTGIEDDRYSLECASSMKHGPANAKPRVYRYSFKDPSLDGAGCLVQRAG